MDKSKLLRPSIREGGKWYRPLFLILVLTCWSSEKAFGIQSHATPEEGFYSHQIGHLFFTLSLVVFAFWLQKTRLVRNKGWRLLQMSCFFFILWNLVATAGHEVELWLSETRFVGPASSKIFLADPGFLLSYLYFFLKLDHFLCVPAMLLLFLGLRTLAADSTEDRS